MGLGGGTLNPSFDMTLQAKKILVTSNKPKLAGFLNPKPMKVTIYVTVDQWSDIMPLIKYGFHTLPNLLKGSLREPCGLCL